MKSQPNRFARVGCRRGLAFIETKQVDRGGRFGLAGAARRGTRQASLTHHENIDCTMQFDHHLGLPQPARRGCHRTAKRRKADPSGCRHLDPGATQLHGGTTFQPDLFA